ncbi:MAG: ATP-binding cassette domain-containing protein [Eggerthella lenta]
MALLRIDGLSKTFLLHRVNRRVQGCQDIDFAIEPGQFVGITGRSGSGKSSILRCMWRTNLPRSAAAFCTTRSASACWTDRPRSARCCTCAPTSWATSPSSSTPCRAKPPTTSC